MRATEFYKMIYEHCKDEFENSCTSKEEKKTYQKIMVCIQDDLLSTSATQDMTISTLAMSCYSLRRKTKRNELFVLDEVEKFAIELMKRNEVKQ